MTYQHWEILLSNMSLSDLQKLVILNEVKSMLQREQNLKNEIELLKYKTNCKETLQ